MATHEICVEPEIFKHVVTNERSVLVLQRYQDSPPYPYPGDLIFLREYEPISNLDTGSTLYCVVIHAFEDPKELGLPADFCLLSVEPRRDP